MSIDNQHEWLDSPLGRYLQLQEQVLFDQAVNDVFGFNAVQLGMPQFDLLRDSRMPFCLKVDNGQGAIRCDASQLPFSQNSIDLLLLPHVLEFNQNPHQALREAERVLVPEGTIIISGFNPISAWGVKRMLSFEDTYPWCGNFLSLLRIRDWLALLGFEVSVAQMTCHALPFSNPAWMRRLQFMEKVGRRCWPGGVYFIVGKKRVAGMRLIRPNWKKSKLNPGFVAAPTQKSDIQKIQHEQ